MAEKKKKVSHVQNILNLRPSQIDRMTEKELRKATTILVSAGNKRVKRLNEAGLGYMPFMQDLEKSGGRFEVKGKKEMQLRAEFMRVKTFLSNALHTVAGAKKAVKEMTQKLAQGLQQRKEKSADLVRMEKEYAKETGWQTVEEDPFADDIQTLREMPHSTSIEIFRLISKLKKNYDTTIDKEEKYRIYDILSFMYQGKNMTIAEIERKIDDREWVESNLNVKIHSYEKSQSLTSWLEQWGQNA